MKCLLETSREKRALEKVSFKLLSSALDNGAFILKERMGGGGGGVDELATMLL